MSANMLTKPRLPALQRGALAEVLFTLVAIVFIVGCTRSHDLSRDEAMKKIYEGLHYPIRVSVGLPASWQFNELQVTPLLRYLEQNKLITLTRQRPQPYEVFPTYDVALTETGKKFLDPRKSEAKDRYRVTMCLLDMTEVTGIHLNGDKTQADVEYMTAANFTSLFTHLASKDDAETKLCLGALEKKGQGPDKNLFPRVVRMALFDDGWRVVK